MRRRIPPADFEMILCPSCGGIIDFSRGLRQCADCKKTVCSGCRHPARRVYPSRCKKCGRNFLETKSKPSRPSDNPMG